MNTTNAGCSCGAYNKSFCDVRASKGLVRFCCAKPADFTTANTGHECWRRDHGITGPSPRMLARNNVRPGDFVMWRKGRTWHRVTEVLDGDPPLIETAYRGTETRGLTLNVRFAIREHLAMPRWMEWMERDE